MDKSFEDALVDSIYEASVVPERWPEVLDQLRHISGGYAAALVAVDLPGEATALEREVRVATTEGYAEPYARYAKYGAGLENVRPKRSLAGQANCFQADVELCSLAELQADPIYKEFLYPFGIGWTGGTTIAVPSADLIVFDICRRIGDGPFDARSLAPLNQFRPHLARAAFVSARLGLRYVQAAAATLEMLGLPCGVLRQSGQVIAANALFERLSPVVSVGPHDRIALNHPAAGERLAASLAAPVRDAVSSIPVPASADSPPLILHLVPVRRAASDVFVGADVLLVATAVAPGPAPNAGVLSGLFDLSPAEAKVARAIAAGSTLAAIATSNGLAYETVRSQLKSLMVKTGTHHQTELVRLLSTSSPFPRS